MPNSEEQRKIIEAKKAIARAQKMTNDASKLANKERMKELRKKANKNKLEIISSFNDKIKETIDLSQESIAHSEKAKNLAREENFKSAIREVKKSSKIFRKSNRKLNDALDIINRKPGRLRVILNEIKQNFKRNISSSKNILLTLFVWLLGTFFAVFVGTSTKIFQYFNVSNEMRLGILFILVAAWFLITIFMQITHPAQKVILSVIVSATLLVWSFYHLESWWSSWIIPLALVLPPIFFITSIEKKEEYSLWFIGTILLMVAILSTGFLGLYSLYSDATIELRLNIDGDTGQRYGLIICDGVNKINDLGQNITCTILPNDAHFLNETLSYNLTLKDNNFTQLNYSGKGNIAFPVPPTETKSLYFEAIIKETYLSNTTFISTYHTQEIHTKDYWAQRDTDFFKYLYYLSIAVFFSIPSMMNNLKNLTDKKKKK